MLRHDFGNDEALPVMTLDGGIEKYFHVVRSQIGGIRGALDKFEMGALWA